MGPCSCAGVERRTGHRCAADKRSPRLLLPLLLACSLTSCAFFSFAPTALAAQKYQQFGQFSRGFSFLVAESVAPNDHNGNIYVADSGSGQVLDFASPSDTSPTVWDGTNTPAESFGGQVSVAVDNSTGDVYVADRNHAVIDKFDQSGNLIESFGDTTPTPNGQLAGNATPEKSFSPAGSYYSSFAIAVDQATHDLYVMDAGHKVIDIFDENGAYLRQITATPAGLYRYGGEYALGLAVNSTSGTVYASDWAGPNLVFQFDSSGNYVKTLDGSNTPDGNFSGSCTGCSLISVATEDSTGKLFVGAMAHSDFDVFDSSGNFVPPQGFFPEFGPSGIAVDQSNGTIYLSSYGSIKIYKPIIVPNLTLNLPSSVTATSAKLTAQVDPASGEGGGPITGCEFEVISNGQFEENTRYYGGNPWTGALQLPCEPKSLPYTTSTAVSAKATGLSPGTEYHDRLTVTNSEGSNVAAGTFATSGSYAFSTDLGSEGSGDDQFKEPQDVAIAAGSGDIYVADTGNHRVVKLDSSGHFLAAWGWGVKDGNNSSEVCSTGCHTGLSGSGAGQFETPFFIAVDNSSGPSAGDVYVGDTGDNVVQKFDPSGALVSGWGTDGAKTYGEGISGIAVNAAGELIVPPGGPGGIAVDKFGHIYGGSVAIDASTSDRYYDTGESIHEYATSAGCDPSDPYIPCPPTNAFGFGDLNLAGGFGGLSINETTKALYVANTGGNDVVVFTLLPVPAVATSPPTNVTLTSGKLIGHVTPGGAGSVSECHFEYGTDNKYGATVPCSPAVSPSGTTEVSAEISELVPFTTYHFRLVVSAENDLGLPVRTEDRTFTTTEGLPPAVDGTSFSELTATDVTLNAQINPKLAPTIYRFQYGTTTNYELQTLPSESIGEDGADHLVSTAVVGLAPATIYHFRVVAVNINGGVVGPDQTFTTPALPTVTENPASEVTQTTATLSAHVRPGFRPTTYHFEYGRTASYGHSSPESGSIGSDNSVYSVGTTISGLAPETTYHYRVVATNEIGPTEGQDLTFTTASVPAERAREEPQVELKCKKGFVKKHGKCVRKRVVRHRHTHRKQMRGGNG